MMNFNSRETEELLELARAGDGRAIDGLFERHRGRLRRMVAARLDRRVAPRLDPSDVLQEAMCEANRRLGEFLRERPVPYYAWLRRLTLHCLSWSHRFHLRSRKRSAARDTFLEIICDGRSSAVAVDCLPVAEASPSQDAIRNEECELVRTVLGRLEGPDRELLELRYVERLSLGEIAARLRIGSSAVKMRHHRALERFRGLLEGRRSEPVS